ncbi:MAG TPA: YceI family protein [Pricia sp.]|nr:YceI family protein [Pricia sp.]
MKRLVVTLFLVNLAATGLAQETYTLAETSALTIDGSSTVHDWTVTANQMQGTLQASPNSLNSVDFSVRVADIKSDRAAAMDKKMHEALKMGEHPKVLFVAKEVDVPLGGRQDLKGTLTIAGVEKEVSIPVNITEADGKLKITGNQKILLKEYGIEPPTAMFGSIVVGDEVTVTFDLVFSKS